MMNDDETWLFQHLPVSTVPNTERNLSNNNYRGIEEYECNNVCFV